ncbi:hypothetical protein SDC9_193427 [bioreactor metagenome]|uniref:Uncharacterized protein n=1 Tax=bioreactor metagenome TaxID=1076179 RepID=A0A645I512_9ZZZZ
MHAVREHIDAKRDERGDIEKIFPPRVQPVQPGRVNADGGDRHISPDIIGQS